MQSSKRADRKWKALVGWFTFAPLLVLSVIGAVAARRRWREFLLAGGLIVVAFVLTLIFYGDARMRLPAIPGFLLLGMAGLRRLAVMLRR